MSYRLKITRTQGREYATIVENVYSKERRGSSCRTVRSCGDLVKIRQSNPNIDEELKEEVRRLNADAMASNQAWVDKHLRSIVFSKERSLKQVNFGIVFYRKIWESLNLHTWFDRARRNSKGAITYDLDLAAFFLASMRILNPKSKKKTFEKRDELLLDFGGLSLDNVYDCLDVLAAKKKTIVSNLNKNLEHVYKRVKTIAFYDVTTFYFESFDSDELRARGMSKENKTNEVQVVLGLLIDGEGIPIDYKLFRGNTSEMNTIVEIVDNYKTQNHLERVTVVADRGLNSRMNLKTLADLKFEYIVAQSIDRLPAAIKREVLRQDNWDDIIVNSAGEDIFKVKTIRQCSAPELDNEIIVTWSVKRQEHDLKVLNERFEKSKLLVEKGAGAVEASFKHGVRQFLKREKGSQAKYTTNDELYEKRVARAGFYALVSSHKDADARSIYHALRQLWHIEECFRIMKTNLNTRPVFVWTPTRIQGHFLVCYLALVMERLSFYQLRNAGVNVSCHKAIELLQEARMTVLEQGKTTLYLRQGVSMNITRNDSHAEAIDEILRVVGIKPLAAIEDTIGLTRKLHVSSNAKLAS